MPEHTLSCPLPTLTRQVGTDFERELGGQNLEVDQNFEVLPPQLC